MDIVKLLLGPLVAADSAKGRFEKVRSAGDAGDGAAVGTVSERVLVTVPLVSQYSDGIIASIRAIDVQGASGPSAAEISIANSKGPEALRQLLYRTRQRQKDKTWAPIVVPFDDPLALAAKEGDEAAVQILLDHGHNCTACNETGQTPFELSWDAEPNSPATLLLLKRSDRIDQVFAMHLNAGLGVQLRALLRSLDPANEQDRQWLGTAHTLEPSKNGLWIRGEPPAMELVVRVVKQTPAV
jgi:hypothetical protein